MRILSCVALAMLLSVAATPGADARSPAAIANVGRGSPLRAVLLNALRPAIARDLRQPVQFVVKELRTDGRWAFAVVEPRTPAGREIDYRKTNYKDAVEAGTFDGGICYALLRREKSGWRVKAFSIGPTDLAWDGWPEEFGVPRELLFR